MENEKNLETTENKETKSTLDNELEHLEFLLSSCDPVEGEKTYKLILSEMDMIYSLKNKINPVKETKKNKIEIDPNVVISGLFGLASLGFVLHYEQLHVITSKAFNFVMTRIPGKRI